MKSSASLRIACRLPVVASLAAMLAACGGSSSSTGTTPATPTTPSQPTNTTKFQGTVAGSGGQSGTLSVTIQATISTSSIRPLAVSQATGSVHLTGAGTTDLSGTYDSATSAVALSGGGFAVNGSVASGVLSGSYTGTGGTGGGFSTLDGTSNTVTTYCGTYGPVFYAGPPANPPGGEVGVWNVVVSSNGSASGAGVSKNVAGDPGFLLQGQLSGTTLTLSSYDLLSHHATGTQSATVQGESVTGSCGGGCTLSASTSACQ